VFRVTDGLQRKYGEHRVLDTPIAEGAIIGAAIAWGERPAPGGRGTVRRLHLSGLRPDLQRAGAARYRSAGEFWAPVTVRTPCGGGIRGGQTHSQSPEAIFTHVCASRS